jgi:hypothetical protein
VIWATKAPTSRLAINGIGIDPNLKIEAENGSFWEEFGGRNLSMGDHRPEFPPIF